ncbi:MAG: sulfotransferase family protein [Deltaproteobacteria bacterium]|nr:sulfotransferase family protein [Deltaproteobacteria bacterium]
MTDTSFITIVSGLPRSGTSMMMQALEAGGLEILTDNLRRRDEDNPKGYYEFEPVKKTKQDPSWVAGARGKAVKVIYSLLYDLPSEFAYRVIFMERNLEEVLASQKTMLERSKQAGADVSNEKLTEVFRLQLAKFDDWIVTQKQFRILRVNHREMITSPLAQCERINRFLDGILDLEKAATAVDPALYRKRRDNP